MRGGGGGVGGLGTSRSSPELVLSVSIEWLDPLQCLPASRDPPNGRWSPTPDRSPFSGPSPGGLW